ncbi:MAG: hypothetical protein ACREFE_19115, partial [Limisphaerales bacterium]
MSTPLTSNTLYTAAIHVTDGNGVSATTNISFDTISPAYTFEAEDFDYYDTNSELSGQFFDNPQTNKYAGLPSTSGVDYVNNVQQGNHDYRPWGLETESLTDKPRLSRGGLQDYDVGWNNNVSPSNWGNYTRHFPTGTYNVFVRTSNGNGQSPDDANLSVASGTAAFNGTGPYTFTTPDTGWGNYVWVPVLDASNNLAVFTSDGSTSTVRVTTDNGNYNANFYMFLPANTNPPAVGSAIVTNIFPNGAYQFQQTNAFSFTVLSTNGINDIEAEVAYTNLAGQGFTEDLTSGNGLTVAGNSTSNSVSFLLTTDAVYSVLIEVTDGNNNPGTTSVNFDTINPNYYTFEAEDFDYGGGNYFDNPQTNLYWGQFGIPNEDYYYNTTPSANSYDRYDALNGDIGGLSTEGVGDVPRLAYINTTNWLGIASEDFDVGFTIGGQWANYTRHYPAGVYNIYARAADGGNAVTDAGKISLITSGYQTTSQTVTEIGTYNVPATGSWGKYAWCPVMINGNLAHFIADGSLKTLRVTCDGAGHNQNFFMLVPANLSENPPPFVSSFYPDGSQLFQFTNL